LFLTPTIQDYLENVLLLLSDLQVTGKLIETKEQKNEKSGIYLHMQRQVRVRMMMTMAATEAPMATATTSPSSSHWRP
jgi:hypothetical protein